jgi:hypothetical protein
LSASFPTVSQQFQVAVFLGVALLVLAWMVRRHSRDLRLERSVLFDDCLSLFSECNLSQPGTRYPKLRAQWSCGIHTHPVSLRAITDTLQTRRLPPLWLFIDVRCALNLQGTLDVLVRPTGVEVFSPSRDLPQRHELPAHWPQNSLLKSSLPDAPEVLARIDQAACALLADPYSKCLTLRPDGLRYVLQIAQSSQAHYMVLRNAYFGSQRLDPQHLHSKMALLGEILDTVKVTDA